VSLETEYTADAEPTLFTVVDYDGI